MPAATTIATGATAAVAVPVGATLRLSGMGSAQIVPPGVPGTDNAPRSISGALAFGPYTVAAVVNVTASGGGASYYVQAAGDSVSVGAGTNDAEELTAAQVAVLQAQASGGGATQPAVTGLDVAASRAQIAHWPCGDSATSLGEAVGKGPPITVAGTTTGALGTAGWFTHDAAGNTLQLKAIPYIDGLIDMTTNGAILIGCDFYLTGWPSTASAVEYLWAVHRSAESTTGGLALTIGQTSAGRFSVQYKSNGGSQNEVTGYTLGTYLSTRHSILVEAIVNTQRSELTIHYFHNGRLERSNVWPLGTPPAASSVCGLNFSGYGSVPANKIGSGGSTGARVQNLLVGRHNGADRNLAGRLARDMAANAALPSWLVRV